ncbi:MAG: UDP-N-acetylmuramoyl-L-alanine--D-glutamate ligase [Candidatus Eiseniibacteriota bacterium]
MIEVTSCRGQTVAVMGLGASGLAAARALVAGGATVFAWDDSAAKREAAEKAGVRTTDITAIDWRDVALLVMSPGIPHRFPKPHPVPAAARAAGVAIVCDVELLARSRGEARYVGITGTNGKSTTTALIGHILTETGHEAEVGGNLGPAALSLKPLGRNGVYVLELSSYQLELILSVAFDVAVLLNITPDHLGRHGGMDGYIAAKRHIFDHARAGATAVVGVDDEPSRKIRAELDQGGGWRVVPVSSVGPAARGVYVKDGALIDDLDGAGRTALDLTQVATLPGAHNWQNAAAAYAVARALGVAPAETTRAIASFPGLPHRQELIAIIDGVRYVNDSKATNADAAEKALVCYDHIYWIAGGQPKEGGIDSLTAHFPRIVHAFLIGEAAQAFAKVLDGRVPYTLAGDLASAVAAARNLAAGPEGVSGGVVLLSPACASFDQFANFEARGDRFRALVKHLPGERQAAGAAA